MNSISRSFVLFIFPLVLLSCVSTPSFDSKVVSSERINIIRSAEKFLGKNPNAKVNVQGRQFTLDCIGTIAAIWWDAGFDIQKDFAKYPGNGVSRLYASLKDKGALHSNVFPLPADIIFWSNTYDRNNNGILYDDGLTHLGMVISVDDDGTVHYLHLSYSRGVVVSFFNLLHPSTPFSPDGKVWNSPMFLGSNYSNKNNPPRWLSGDLWTVFGDADKAAGALK